jgi:DNA-3-methyladenine glycosylase II
VKGNALNPSVITEAESFLRRRDRRLAALIRDVGSCTICDDRRSKFEILVSSIVAQQLSGKAAATIKERLICRAGGRERLPQALSAMEVEDLRACGLSATKANTILRIAELVAKRSLDLDGLQEADDDVVYRELTAISGVGPWTSQMFLIFGLLRPDVFSVGDAGLRRGLQVLYELQEKPTENEMLAITNRWRPYRTVGAWYLWRLLD